MGQIRKLSLADRMIINLDRAVRSLRGSGSAARRERPGHGLEDTTLSAADRRRAAGLMRVNHAGEVAAQALYHGQALTAGDSALRETLEQAAREEEDHLNWCRERLGELESRASLLDPLWYAGGFAFGAAAGLAGEKINLGFLAETERQVVRHLDDHLERLPEPDRRSRAILEQMREDEAGHAGTAEAHGAAELPGLVRRAMTLASRVMTRTAYWV
ncbi:MAG: 2-polyprenyl-3-methyl-6-methoxy-1,4-benzoquinone monooxygenase [Gammaproteobacteria bacterium]|nr:2-polyprenyl-3-methyl-6-methoxy-1,4-benzoquinone monooxygenase [Gammaproteobacteria bacterium]